MERMECCENTVDTKTGIVGAITHGQNRGM